MAEAPRILSPLTFKLIIFSSSFNLDYLALTSSLMKSAATAWWVPVAASFAISLAVTYILAIYPTRMEGVDMVEWMQNILGKGLGSSVTLLFAAGLVLISAVALSHVVRLTQMILLPGTPTESLFLVTLLTCVTISRLRFTSITRFTLVVTLVSVPMILISAAFLFLGSDVTNFMPLASPEMLKSLRGVEYVLPQYRGASLLMLIGPYAIQKETLRKDSITAVSAGILSHTLMIAATVAVLGTSSTWLLNPTLIAYQAVQFTASGIERVDFLYIVASILIGCLLIIRPLFFSSFLTARTLKLNDHGFITLFFAPIIYGLAILPSNQKSILDFYTVSGWIYWIVTLGIPVVVALYALLRRRIPNATAKQG